MKGFLKTILWTLLFLLLYFLSNVIVAFIVGMIGATTKSINSLLNDIFQYTLFYGSIISIILFMLIFRKKLTPKFKKFENKNHLKQIFLIGTCTAFITFGLVNFTILIVDTPINGTETLQMLSNGINIFTIISVVLLAPINEEILCRGLIFEKAKEHTNIIVAIIFQALIFAVLHGNILQGSYAFFLGIIFALVYLKIETLWAPILLHIVHNTLNVVVSFIIPESLSDVPIVLLIIGLAPIPFLIILLKKIGITLKKHRKQEAIV